MRLLSLFSGIGAFEKALALNGMDYELVNYCEIDSHASKAYSVIHNVSEELNLRDVKAVDTTALKDIDLLTYGFPCQDISQAGEQKGFVDDDGNVTRSGLFFEALRIIMGVKPKVAIAENVKALTTKKFTKEFDIVLRGLDTAGYNNYWAVLNAKDYGTPQNRERVFIISIRKDIDNGTFEFPAPIPLTTRLKDVLETNVDEKFYLSDAQIQRIKTTSYMSGQRRIQDKDWCDTLCARDWKDPKCVRVASDTAKVMQVGNLRQGNGWDNPQCGRVYDTNGISPTLNTMQGGDRQPKIVCEQRSDEGLRFFKDGVCGTLRTIDACGDKRVLEPVERMTKQAYETLQENDCKAGDVINPFNKRVVNDGVCPTLTTRPEGFKTANLIVEHATAAAMRGRDNGQQIELSDREYSNALTTVQKDSLVAEHAQEFRIRKLTPLECWRLMGFTDDDCNKVKAVGISNSQLYKMAGNSICVSVLQAIFNQLRGTL